MTAIALIDLLTAQARKFRADTGFFERNDHMHDIVERPQDDVVDAVLSGFINHIGMFHGIDVALYASDLAKNPDSDKQNT